MEDDLKKKLRMTSKKVDDLKKNEMENDLETNKKR